MMTAFGASIALSAFRQATSSAGAPTTAARLQTSRRRKSEFARTWIHYARKKHENSPSHHLERFCRATINSLTNPGRFPENWGMDCVRTPDVSLHSGVWPWHELSTSRTRALVFESG